MQSTKRKFNCGIVVSAVVFGLLPAAFCVAPSGCASDGGKPTSRPLTARERQERALKDPFNYKPDSDQSDISGGGISDFDRDAFNRDLKNVLSP